MRAHFAASALLAVMLAPPLGGCVVVEPGRHVHHAGPPPHAPAHGYRHKHRDRDLVFDADLGVYVVVGLADVWFLDGSYFRLMGDRWEVGVEVGGPWRVASVGVVPVRLYEKRHPHGGPPGQAKKGNGKRKH